MNILKTLTLSIVSLTTLSSSYSNIPKPAFPCCPTEAQGVGRPDGHGPISIMGDHTHAKDGCMLSYRYMNMQMDGMRTGSSPVSENDVFAANYAVSPKQMTMDMHMLGAMYAPSDQLTLMMMAHYIETSMDHLVNPVLAGMINNGQRGFTTESSGLGDIKVSALYRFYLEENRKAHVGLGISLPTGAIDLKDDTPAMGGRRSQQLPAPMQLGSGTFDLLPSLTFVEQFKNWSWGGQANGVVRLENENENNYRLGHQFEMLGWAGYNLSKWIGLNGGLSYRYAGKLKRDQDAVNQMGPDSRDSVTTAFGENYGGERIDIILGVNLLQPSGIFEGHRLSLDVRLPLWQDFNGYQLETDSAISIGWQKAF